MKPKIIFHECLKDAQHYGSNDEYMVSRIFFSFVIDNKTVKNCYVNVKQAVGTDFKTGPIEVEQPIGYKGPFNYEAFRKAAENYYRSLDESEDQVINISDSKNIRMKNNLFKTRSIVEI